MKAEYSLELIFYLRCVFLVPVRRNNKMLIPTTHSKILKRLGYLLRSQYCLNILFGSVQSKCDCFAASCCDQTRTSFELCAPLPSCKLSGRTWEHSGDNYLMTGGLTSPPTETILLGLDQINHNLFKL